MRLPPQPARPLTRQPADFYRPLFRYRGHNRSQDRLFLGPSHEVVPCRRRVEGSQSTGRQTLCIAERRYAHFSFTYGPAPSRWLLIETVSYCYRYSSRSDGLYLGALLAGYYACQLFARSGECYVPAIGSDSVLMCRLVIRR